MTDLSLEIKQRRERHQQLEILRAKLMTQIEGIQADRQRAGKEAREKYGVNTLAELMQKRDEMEKQNSQALAEYDAGIAAFEASLKEVQAAVSSMGM